MAKKQAVNLNSLLYQRGKVLEALEASEAMQKTLEEQTTEYDSVVPIDWDVWSRMHNLLDTELYDALRRLEKMITEQRVIEARNNLTKK